MLALLGYAFLIGVVIGVLVLVGVTVYYARLNFVVVKFLLIPLGIAGVVLRSLWVTFPVPDGHELRYEDAPRLFDLAKTTRKATNGPRVHKLLLSDDSTPASCSVRAWECSVGTRTTWSEKTSNIFRTSRTTCWELSAIGSRGMARTPQGKLRGWSVR